MESTTMSKPVIGCTLVMLVSLLAACKPPPAQPGVDMAELRQEIQQKTERMYWIHLRLDTASTEISNAETAAVEGNVSAAEFHASEAYRSLQQADEALLELGRQMQEMVNLDQNPAGQ